MIKNKRSAKNVAERFIEKSFPSLASENLEIHRVGEIWTVDVRSRITGAKRLSIKIDGRDERIARVELPKKLDEDIIKKRIKTCPRCGKSFSLQELRITRTKFEGSHGHILVINVSCPKCRRALSPIRIARKGLKMAYLEYLEAAHLSPEYYAGSRR